MKCWRTGDWQEFLSVHLKAEDLLSPLHIDEKLHGATYERQTGQSQMNIEKLRFGQTELQWNGRNAQDEVHRDAGHRHQEDFNGPCFSPTVLLLRIISSWTWTPQGPED